MKTLSAAEVCLYFRESRPYIIAGRKIVNIPHLRAFHLDKIFSPQRIALVGASDDLYSVGGILLCNLIDSQFQGETYPVNIKGETVQGIQPYNKAEV